MRSHGVFLTNGQVIEGTILLDTTKYEYPDISFRTMYIPTENNGSWQHNFVPGLEWTDPLRPDIFPYWLHWTVGLRGNISFRNGANGGAAYNPGFSLTSGVLSTPGFRSETCTTLATA